MSEEDQPASSDRVLTVAEVSGLLRVIDETVLRLLRAGDLKGFKVGATWRVFHSDLEAFIADHANW